jgi:hypothetical protein
MPFELLFILQAQPFGRGAASDDDASCLDPFSVNLEPMMPLGGFKFFELGVPEPGTEFFRLFMHIHDQLRPVDAIRKTGEILDQRGRSQLTARFSSLENERSQVGPRGVNCGSQSGAPRSNNHYCFHGRVMFHQIRPDAKYNAESAGSAGNAGNVGSAESEKR